MSPTTQAEPKQNAYGVRRPDSESGERSNMDAISELWKEMTDGLSPDQQEVMRQLVAAHIVFLSELIRASKQ